MKASRSPVRRADASTRSDFGEFERRRQPDGSRDVLGAAAPTALLPAAVQQRLERDPAADAQGAGALRRPDLVPGDGDRVDAELRRRQRQPPGCLHRVDVHRDAALPGDRGDGRDILDRAHLVVRVADAHERRVVAQGACDVGRGDPRLGVDRHMRDVEPVHAGQVLRGLQHRLVLDGRRDEVAGAASELRGDRDALDREVVRLGAARGEDDVAGAEAEHARHARPGVGERLGRGFADGVVARRVAEPVGEERHHRLEHLGPHRTRRGVVEVAERHVSPAARRDRSRCARRGRGRGRGRSG